MKKYFIVMIHLLIVATAFGQSAKRHFLLRDEGISQLAYIDEANPNNNWYTPLPTGRDMQLVGNGRVLVGTGNGYEEYEIKTGKKVFEMTTFPGTLTAHRLRNGNTLLTGLNWQGKEGIILLEIDPDAVVKQLYSFPGLGYPRLVRETATGNFLITADDYVLEANTAGEILWKVKVAGKDKPHVWQALRLANGQTVASCGYSANLQVFNADGSLAVAITGPAEVRPNFFAGFQVLANGNYVVINWQGHGPNFGTSGTQLLEFTPAGKLVWSWQQDATKFSSLHSVIILDGLDTNFLHVEDKNGMLAPVKAGR